MQSTSRFHGIPFSGDCLQVDGYLFAETGESVLYFSLVDRTREKVGQMIMIGLKGEEISQDEEKLLREYPFGGFIFFSRNLKEPKQILSLCRSLWEKRIDLPPFIAIDHEGGRVHRLPAPFTHFPAAAALGRTGDADLAFGVGLAMARELSAVGINLNFAPALDVLSNPNNLVIGDRALGSDPHEVARLGWSIIRGLRKGGVIPCAKHFPGHGDTSKDSHLELPVVNKEVAELMATELPPFIYACRSRAEALMTAHVLYPALDPNLPASLSPSIVRRLLRRELEYKGIVFTDDLEMKAISRNYSLEDAVRLGVSAGTDVLLFCRQKKLAVEAFEFLYRTAVKKISMRERVEESWEKIRSLKARHLKSFRGSSERKLKEYVSLSPYLTVAREIEPKKSP